MQRAAGERLTARLSEPTICDTMAIMGYHLFNSAVIGLGFGWFLGRGDVGYAGGLARGIGYGIFWWILGAQILMPLFLGMPPFASVRMPPMRPVALGSLAGHVIYGLILGLVYASLHRAEPARRIQTAPR